MNVLKKIPTWVVACLFLASCANNGVISRAQEFAKAHTSDTFINEARSDARTAYVTVVDGIFLAGSVGRLRDPDFFDEIMEYEAKSITKDDLYLQIMEQFKNHLVIDPDVLRHPRDKKVGHISSFSGTRKEFLNYLCHIYECSWAIADGTAQVSRLVSRSWVVDISSLVEKVGGEVQTQSRSGQSGGSGQVTQSGASVSSKTMMDRFKEIKSIVKTMAGEGATVTVSPALSMLTVMAPRDRIEVIDKLVKQINQKATRMIALQVEIVTVKAEEGNERGLNLDMVFNNGNLGVDYNVLNLVDSDAGNLEVAITDPEDEFIGSKALIQSLSKLATITSRQSNSLQTMDGAPVSVRKATKEAFFEVTTNVVPQTGQTLSEITVNEVPIGFSLTMTPHIASGGKDVLVSLQINNSRLNRKESLSLGSGSFVQYPVTDNDDLASYVRVRDGGAIILSLNENDVENSTSQGPLHHAVPLLGGAKSRNASKEKTFVIVHSEIL